MQLTKKILTKKIYAMSTIIQNSTDEVVLIDYIKTLDCIFSKYKHIQNQSIISIHLVSFIAFN